MNSNDIPGARHVGRRLEGTPENWNAETQAALRAMKNVAAELNIEAPKPELHNYVRLVTDRAAMTMVTDPVFNAKVEAVVQVCADRRAHEGYPFDGYDFNFAQATAAVSLTMALDFDEVERASTSTEET